MAETYNTMREWQLAVSDEVQERLTNLPASRRTSKDIAKVSAQVQRDMASRKPSNTKPKTPKKRSS